ncbi:MAG: rhodanese-like domain-containing protein [Actinomycetota bacterium]|nr:rhodanese-like domain-containing protein [Actinomycetota bacterium]
MSPRAAWRLESLGFGEVYDYVGSKMEWIGDGLPFEGTLADQARLSTVADPAVPTCTIDETVADVRGRLGGWDIALAVAGPGRVVVGLVRAEALGLEGGRTIAEVMQEGPSTYRPHVGAQEMSENLKRSPAPFVVVTTISGRLVGVARPDAIHAAASEG